MQYSACCNKLQMSWSRRPYTNTQKHKATDTDIYSLLVFCGKWQKTNCDERCAQTITIANVLIKTSLYKHPKTQSHRYWHLFPSCLLWKMAKDKLWCKICPDNNNCECPDQDVPTQTPKNTKPQILTFIPFLSSVENGKRQIVMKDLPRH